MDVKKVDKIVANMRDQNYLNKVMSHSEAIGWDDWPSEVQQIGGSNDPRRETIIGLVAFREIDGVMYGQGLGMGMLLIFPQD